MEIADVAIVGAGPYGLSATAHLQAANGLDVRIFGEPMSFWERHMPRGMLLRSPWEGSYISDPDRALTLDAYQAAGRNHLSRPVPLDRFIDYGHWFRGHAVPDLDLRKVVCIDPDHAGFRLTLEGGELLKSRRVIVAAGIAPFAWHPPQFERLPHQLASHSAEHRDFARFMGKQVVVIGGGQSALESAALLHEVGAEVEVIVRAPMIHWLWRQPWLHTCKPVSKLLYAPPDVGPAGVSHLIARPNWFRRLPWRIQNHLVQRSVRPAGAAWLKPRLEAALITTGRCVVSATAMGERVILKLDDGSERRVDHVLLATGYRVDISRYAFLMSELLASIRQVNGYPELDTGFESSVPGLHFLGAPAAWSFGPLMRFVAGTEFASRALTRKVLRGETASKVRTILAAKPSVAGLASRALEEAPRQGLGAIVMGADYRSLGVVRSLGRRGVPVWVLTAGGQLLAATSRYARRRLSWPAGDDRKRVDFLLELAAKHNLKGWVLFATDDYSVALLAHHHDLLAAQFRLTVPPWNVLGWVCDKRLMHQLADRVAVDQPWTRCPRNREDLAQLACPFPFILKPAMRLELNRFTAAKAWRVTDRQSLLARYDEACTLVAPDLILLQELIPGGGESQFSFAALCQGGRPLAWVVARRARQIPMDFGRFSTYVETVDERGVVEPAVRMLSAIGFTGLVEVEFKRDARDGRYKLLDINPRVWGWHTLCGRAGVDFPYLLWRLAQGEPVPEVRGRAGVRWVRMSADLPAATLEVLRGRLTLGAYVRSLGGPRESAIFASDDPLPGLLELPLLAYLLGERFLRGKEPVLSLFATRQPQLNGRR